MTALSVNGVSKAFKSRKRVVRAVSDVSFEVGDGEVFGLLGTNGAGKSTTIKMCTGLLDPDGGSIEVFGHDMRTETEAAKSLLNVSPQETAVAPLLSVRENLELIAAVYGADNRSARTAANEIAEKLGLSNRLNDRAGKLSGGLMRRLSVGMALITKPRLVFLDEPTLGLDIVARRELWRYIREIKKTAAVVLTTHYLEEAEALCDRIAVMAHGEIAAVGTPDELKAKSGVDNFEDAFLVLSGVGELTKGGDNE